MGSLLQIYLALSALTFKLVTVCQDGKLYVLFYFIIIIFLLAAFFWLLFTFVL